MKTTKNTSLILAIGGITLVVVGFLLISGLISRMFSPKPAATLPPPIIAKVVITTHDLALGSVINSADLAVAEVPLELVPANALDDIAFATGRMTTIPMVAGEMVLANHLADPTNITHDLAFVLKEDQVLMAFPATDLISTINLLKRGDLVDILASIQVDITPEQAGVPAQGEGEEIKQESQQFTFSALQRITISAVVMEVVSSSRKGSGLAVGENTAASGLTGTPQPTPTPSLSEIETKALLLALSPQDALVLKHLKDAGAVFDIVLRSPTSSQIFDTNAVSQDYLIDRYKLEIIR